MSSRIIPTYSPDLNPDSICENCSVCLHWDASLTPVYATVAGRRIQVAQCVAGDNSSHESAPYAEVQGPYEAVIMTHAESRCPAFELHPDAADDLYANVVHYAELDRQLTRDAWM